MAYSLPEPLKALVEQLSGLPGLGPKSAMRMAIAMLKWPEARTRQLGAAIGTLRDSLALCGRCGAISSAEICPICADPDRDQTTLCIVPEWDSLLALEAGGFYSGCYFVLGGLLAPMQKDSQPEFTRLYERLAEGGIAEVILALGSTLEAENTATFIKQELARKFPAVRVSRLAQGLPLGAEVKYMDRETLRQSMQHRQQL